MFSFIDFRLLDALDILLVAFLIYQLFLLIRGTIAINIFFGILSIYIIWHIVRALEMQLLSTIIGTFMGVGVIAIIIVFQQEIRRFLLIIGTKGLLNKNNIIHRILMFNWEREEKSSINIQQIIMACKRMSTTKTGALIVLIRNSRLKFYIDSGDVIDAKVSAYLIESIFLKNSPLHDGAIIIEKGIIKAVRCVLPVAEDVNFPSSLGFRHRAALGITKLTDAIAIAVSEETGNIALAKDGKLHYNISPQELQTIIENEFHKKLKD